MGCGSRFLVVLSAAFGLVYPMASTLQLSPVAAIAVKGAGVGLLALVAALRARTADGWLLAAVLALGALGDVLLEIEFAAGAAAFAVGHVCAMALYLRHRRQAGPAGWAVAALLLAAAAAIPGWLLEDRPEQVAFILYGLLLGGMTATAWLSRLHFLVPLGAAMFLASDIMIAARIGMAPDLPGLNVVIWLFYYSGQVLIFAGVLSSLPAEPAGRGTTGSAVEV